MLELLNGICLCPGCHKFFIGLSAHENPIRVYDWLKDNRPISLEVLRAKTEEIIREKGDNRADG